MAKENRQIDSAAELGAPFSSHLSELDLHAPLVPPGATPPPRARTFEAEGDGTNAILANYLAFIDLSRLSREDELVLSTRLVMRALPIVERVGSEATATLCQLVLRAWVRLYNVELPQVQLAIRQTTDEIHLTEEVPEPFSPLQRQAVALQLVGHYGRLAQQAESATSASHLEQIVRQYLICIDALLMPRGASAPPLTDKERQDTRRAVDALEHDFDSLLTAHGDTDRAELTFQERWVKNVQLLTSPLWTDNSPSWWKSSFGWPQLHRELRTLADSAGTVDGTFFVACQAAAFAKALEVRYPSLVKQ